MAGRGKKAACKTPRRVAQVETPELQEKPLRPSQCRAYMRQTVAAEFRGIVKGFVESAKQGSCQHVKLATEMMATPKRTRLSGRGKVEAILKKLEQEKFDIR